MTRKTAPMEPITDDLGRDLLSESLPFNSAQDDPAAALMTEPAPPAFSGQAFTPAFAGSLDMKLADALAKRQMQALERSAEKKAGKKVKSDGGSTSYYLIPEGAAELNDLIEHKKMGFALGNIFKACYRLGEKDGADVLYDLNKMVYFAQERLIPYVKKHGRLP